MMSEDIRGRIQADRIAAMKSGDSGRKVVLDYILGELQKADKGSNLKGSENERAQGIIKAYIKSLKDFIDQHGAARAEEAARYEKEIEILLEYLPRQLSDEEVRAEVESIIASGVTAKGLIMAELKKRHGAALDGRRAAEIAGELAQG